MNPTDFTSAAPGRLVTTIDRSTVAFVPNPIPRTLTFPTSTFRLATEAEYDVGRLAGVVAKLVNPYLVASPLLRREAILSSRMEGTLTTPEDLAVMQAAAKPPVPLQSREEDTKEVINYIRAMEHGLRRIKEIPMSLRLIKELHEVLLKGVRGDRERPGEFRAIQNFIGSRQADIGAARFVPPPVAELAPALDDFEKYLHEETPDTPPELIRMALIHYQFETIHPFRDGNGRIGRLMIPLLMISSGRMTAPTLYLSSFFEPRRQDYVDLLLRVSQRGDWLPWVNFFLEGVRTCAREARAQAQGLLDLRARYLAQFRSARSSALLQTLIETLFKAPSITIGQATKLLNVSAATASSNLKKLAEAGVVQEITGKRKGQLYIAHEIMNFDVADTAAAEAVEREGTVAPENTP